MKIIAVIICDYYPIHIKYLIFIIYISLWILFHSYEYSIIQYSDSDYNTRFVVWNIFLFFHIFGNVITPTDELIFFREIGSTIIELDDGKILTGTPYIWS
jgi:hypothetical protein